MIDVALRLAVADRTRRFDLDIAFSSSAAVVALHGPSGAGKSLTLQAMAGLRRPDAGHVRIGGRTLFDAARGIDVRTEARRVGYLFQHYALFPHLSVRRNVAFGLTSWHRGLSPGDARHVDDLLESFGLAELAQSRPGSLSGGQQQRVALARALACRPQVLLLDEPFAALHPALRRQLREEVRAARERWNVPIVLITHDVDDVIALADVAFLVDGGRVTREVDLRLGTSRELASHRPQPAPDPAASADRALRVALLAGFDPA